MRIRRLLALTASAVVTASLLGYFPLTDVRLTLTLGDRRWELGTADATDREQQYAISWTVVIPNDVDAGAATLRAESAVLPVQIR